MKLTFHGAKVKLIKIVLLSLHLGKGLPLVHVFLRLHSCSLQLSPFSLRGPLSFSLSPRGVGPCRVCLPFTAISTLLAAERGEREETDRGDD